MGSLSLYRGNLHRVSNAPREWLMPPRKVSLNDFKSLLLKRHQSLRDLPSSSSSNPNPNPNSITQPAQQHHHPKHEFVGESGCSKQKDPQITASKPPPPQLQATASGSGRAEKEVLQQHHHRVARCAKDQSGSDGETRVEKRKRSRDVFSSPDIKPEVARVANDCDQAVLGASQDLNQAKQKQLATVPAPAPVEAPVQITKNLESLSVKEKEKKKRDLQHNLEVLNGRKHNLVQMLKQVLNTEEEMKRRISVKASGFAAPVRQLMEATTDLGSNPGQVHRAQGDFCGDMQEESEDISNSNTHTRPFHRKRSTSPSASSPHRKVAHSPRQHSVVPPYNRQSSGVSGNTQASSSMLAGVASSPSRFTPPGHQGHPGNLPPLSVSGTQCTTSSPSPAGSGGTSVFRDARITSPSWN